MIGSVMNNINCLWTIPTGICIGAIVLSFWKQHHKKRRMQLSEVCPAESAEAAFVREWTTALKEYARTFNGLYNGLLRVQGGSAKKPEKVLREWCQRTHCKLENQSVDTLCQEYIQPLIEAVDCEGLAKWAGTLLDAAAAAGISKEVSEKLVLTEDNADAYVEWDGNDLYPDDEIEIITPAWYQNGKLLEQGQCKVISAKESSHSSKE